MAKYLGNRPTAVPLTSADIQDGVITAADLGANSVDSSELVDGSIDTSHIGALQVTEAKIAADAVTLAKMASGTDGNVISYDASGNPVAIATGDDGQVLTSAGAGQPPAFEAVAAGGQYAIVSTTYDCSTTGALALTGAGFEPKFIWLHYDVGDWVAGRMGWGFSDGTSEVCMNDANQQTSDSWKSTSARIQDHIHSSSNYSYLDLASFDADGCTLTKSKYMSPSGTVTLSVAFFG